MVYRALGDIMFYKYKIVDGAGMLWKAVLTRRQALRLIPELEKRLNRKLFLVIVR